jgi:ketosteroid isomerase-like protein
MDVVEELRQLNDEYVAAAVAADVDWYEQHLAADFVCIDSDAVVYDKEEFLRQTSKGRDLEEYRVVEVDIRVYGDVGLVRAAGAWTSIDGRQGQSRYVDIYVRDDDGWKTVSAQISRPRTTSP